MELYKTSLPNLEFLEVMVINACNLSCAGCTTFSDLKHSGYVTWKQGRDWLEPWTNRINIQAIGMMGGEPLMNPELRQWLLGIRELLPETQIRVVTNGLLLHKHWWILDLLDTLGNSVLKISQHVDDPRLTDAIDHVFSSRDWKPINEYGIDRWVSSSGLRFQIVRPTQFLKTFKGEYVDAAPHDSDPAQAFSICVQKKCPLLFDEKIWKCGTAALTPPMLERFDWPNRAQWEPFIVPGLESTCSNEELNTFVNNFGKPHGLCKQCPSTTDTGSRVDHASTVAFK
jgi:organic radical activating enzyme